MRYPFCVLLVLVQVVALAWTSRSGRASDLERRRIGETTGGIEEESSGNDNVKASFGLSELACIIPREFPGALSNPMKGFRPELEALVGAAFSEAFQNKKFLLRRASTFINYELGICWDRWADSEQMRSIWGAIWIRELNEATGLAMRLSGLITVLILQEFEMP